MNTTISKVSLFEHKYGRNMRYNCVSAKCISPGQHLLRCATTHAGAKASTRKMPDRYDGVVVYFDNNEGYGCIRSFDPRKEYWGFYREAIQVDGVKTLRRGQNVIYETIDTAIGPQVARIWITSR